MGFSISMGIQVTKAKGLSTGVYTGSKSANRVVDIGFTPVAVWVYPVDAVGLASAAAAIVEHHSNSFEAGMWAENTDHFQGIVEGGFKTGTNVLGEGTNLFQVTYFWMAWG